MNQINDYIRNQYVRDLTILQQRVADMVEKGPPTLTENSADAVFVSGRNSDPYNPIRFEMILPPSHLSIFSEIMKRTRNPDSYNAEFELIDKNDVVAQKIKTSNKIIDLFPVYNPEMLENPDVAMITQTYLNEEVEECYICILSNDVDEIMNTCCGLEGCTDACCGMGV
jgi:hypothetical protein